MIFKNILIFIIILLIFNIKIYSDNFNPFNFNKNNNQNKQIINNKIINNSLFKYNILLSIKIYQNYISNNLNTECPSYPSCSNYSINAIKKYGVFKGIILTTDRLLHEGSEIKKGFYIKINHKFKIYDPVNNNTFWWDKTLKNNLFFNYRIIEFTN